MLILAISTTQAGYHTKLAYLIAMHRFTPPPWQQSRTGSPFILCLVNYSYYTEECYCFLLCSGFQCPRAVRAVWWPTRINWSWGNDLLLKCPTTRYLEIAPTKVLLPCSVQYSTTLTQAATIQRLVDQSFYLSHACFASCGARLLTSSIDPSNPQPILAESSIRSGV